MHLFTCLTEITCTLNFDPINFFGTRSAKWYFKRQRKEDLTVFWNSILSGQYHKKNKKQKRKAAVIYFGILLKKKQQQIDKTYAAVLIWF